MYNKHGGYYGSKDVLDYSININPIGVSDKLRQALIGEIDNLKNYPEIGGSSAIESLATYNGIDRDNVILGNGATELIYLFSRALEIGKAIVVEPTFTEYRKSLEAIGASVEEYIPASKDLTLNVDEFLDSLNRSIDAIFICNPNNPTGAMIDLANIEKILERAKEKGIVTFIDESFMEFSRGESALKFIDKYSLFVLKSITKIYAVPGIRIGYGIASSDIVGIMNRKKEPWSVNSLALKTVEVYVGDLEYMSKTKTWFDSEKERFIKQLSCIRGIEVFDSEANFVLVRLRASNTDILSRYLLDRGYYIRICDDFYGLDSSYIRLAIRKRKENDGLIGALYSFFRGE